MVVNNNNKFMVNEIIFRQMKKKELKNPLNKFHEKPKPRANQNRNAMAVFLGVQTTILANLFPATTLLQ